MKRKVKKTCEYSRCPYDDPSIAMSDKTSVFAHLGARTAYIIITWALIGNLLPGQSFFNSAFMISLSLCMSYAQFTSKDKSRKWLARSGYIISILWVVISLFCSFSGTIEMGLDGAYVVFKNHVAFNHLQISILAAWILMGCTLVVIPTIEWIAYISFNEQQDVQDLSTVKEGRSR
jgi:hypothetical protein